MAEPADAARPPAPETAGPPQRKPAAPDSDDPDEATASSAVDGTDASAEAALVSAMAAATVATDGAGRPASMPARSGRRDTPAPFATAAAQPPSSPRPPGRAQLAPPPYRSSLPAPMTKGEDGVLGGFMSALRGSIGKDLTKLRMPVALNEPLSALQTLCEELEYQSLLNEAAKCSDPVERIALVSAFAISGYASKATRTTRKPFNPLLGETYELDRTADMGFRYVAEQVSHHPPIGAAYADSDYWVWLRDARIRNSLSVSGMDVESNGLAILYLRRSFAETMPPSWERYTWNRVTMTVHNILSGTRWLEFSGILRVRNASLPGLECQTLFVPDRGRRLDEAGNRPREIKSRILDVTRNQLLDELYGTWNGAVHSRRLKRRLWAATPLPPQSADYYGFTSFAMQLNEVSLAHRGILRCAVLIRVAASVALARRASSAHGFALAP